MYIYLLLVYIVFFNSSTLNEDIEKFYDEYGCSIKIFYKYSTEFNGFLAKLSDSTLSKIKSHPIVDRVGKKSFFFI